MNSTPEKNGLYAKVSKKSEINLTADHAGLSEQLKLSQIEYVLLLNKKIKPEFLVKIYYLAVLDFSPVVWDVMEDTLMQLGLTLKKLDLLQETYTIKTNIVNHTHSLLVTIT
jgi:hypothetical protein